MVPVVVPRAKHRRQAYRRARRRCQMLRHRGLRVGRAPVVDAVRRAVGRRSRCCAHPLAARRCGPRGPLARSAASTSSARRRLPRSTRDRAATDDACAAVSTACRPVSPYSVTPSTTDEHGVDDRPAARRAGHEHDLAVLDHHRRRHRAEHPLARIDQVGRRADVAARVRVARLLVEVTHLVVQEEPGALARRRASRSRLRACRCSSTAMPSRSITEKCVVSSGSGGCGDGDDVLAELEAARGLVQADRRRDRFGVRLRRELGDRDGRRSPVAEMPRAIEVGAPHRFDLEMKGRRREQPLVLRGCTARGC